jgi:hypothetical protein
VLSGQLSYQLCTILGISEFIRETSPKLYYILEYKKPCRFIYARDQSDQQCSTSCIVLNYSSNNRPNETLSAYHNNRLESLGCCHLKCVHQKGKYTNESTLAFHVVDTRSPPILGIRPCLE